MDLLIYYLFNIVKHLYFLQYKECIKNHPQQKLESSGELK